MAGPNGSGKSTVLKAVYAQFYSGLFVNADEIEKSFKKTGFVNSIL
jgi:predicted ABC-type ATPase